MDEKKETAEEIDFFTKFMFGETREVDESWKERRRKEREWLFGAEKKEQKKPQEAPSSSNAYQKIGEKLERIDYLELMGHIDTLMASASELKPLFKKLKPLLTQVIDKK